VDDLIFWNNDFYWISMIWDIIIKNLKNGPQGVGPYLNCITI